MVKQPGHLTSMKNERGAGTRFCGVEVNMRLSGYQKSVFWSCRIRTLSLCLRASAAGVGLRRSTARTYPGNTTLASMSHIHESVYLASPDPPRHLNEVHSCRTPSPAEIPSSLTTLCPGRVPSPPSPSQFACRKRGSPYHLDGLRLFCVCVSI